MDCAVVCNTLAIFLTSLEKQKAALKSYLTEFSACILWTSTQTRTDGGIWVFSPEAIYCPSIQPTCMDLSSRMMNQGKNKSHSNQAGRVAKQTLLNLL